MLALLASSAGFPFPRGGARTITDALLKRIEEYGGSLQLSTHVDRIVVREGRAVAVRTSDGTEIEAKRAIVADVGAPALYLSMLDERHVPSMLRRSMERYPYAWGTFKVDWALSGPVPWNDAICRRSAVVHLGDSIDDLARFTAEVRAGQLPTRPYMVLGQQSLGDPTRAPAGQHTLYGYTHVPSTVDGGWPRSRERMADVIEARIEEQAPGFRAAILARSISSPPDLEAMDENLVGGDLGGGSAGILNQLVFRPSFPWFGHRTPVRGLYLGSSYAHPGTGVHGMCGLNAANAALKDVR
jgi:phytoene dehydrogenase-like protein